jgi:hypothetical protein
MNIRGARGGHQQGRRWRQLFPVGKFEAILMIADEAAPHAEGMLAEFGVGPFHLALEKVLADHPGTTNFYGVPQVEYTHSFTFSRYFLKIA